MRSLRVRAELVASGTPRRAGTTGWRGSCGAQAWGGAIGADRSTPRGVILRPRQRLIWRERPFTAPTPDQLWIADITDLPTEAEGFLYLGVILDVLSRRVVGWSMADHRRTELVLAALEMAI